MSKSNPQRVWSPLQTTGHSIDDIMLTEHDEQDVMTTLDTLVR